MTILIPSHTAGAEKPAGRIRQANESRILAAAAQEFARHGFKGTTMLNIAEQAELPKANLHYYFTNKLSLYVAVLTDIIELWDSTFNHLSVDDDPATALSAYIRAKMEFSRLHPEASRIFAMEVIGGCPCLSEHFDQDYQTWFIGRTAVFKQWIAAGRMDPVDPAHLIFLLWSSTQHYADFGSQICRVLGREHLDEAEFERARRSLTHVILKGCGLQPPPAGA
ncbi:TetR/AcrR family transcriptional regulator [Pseudomonas sp. Gutcm_11s]|uniref:TetR/AcrR family transcriptional regulator n=1 Tax=Pseudomonas sp. Gutcm_11s TaxID=3026088 RepID=UPI00235EDFC5|nr:TetR/AcrR family transcriptional regulator [Pseudomonas sp. Gutcm_11s]MDD0843962.1 TetR/AcrR family transcriptional regulator [Pseudomonas sp. Gutcm_11s]